MEKDLTKGSPFRLIVAFALPVLIGGLLQQTYSFADTLIVGRTISSNALAAVGLCSPIVILMQAIAWGLPNGFALYTAQRFGARDPEGVRKSIALSLWFGLLLSAVLTVVTILPLNLILRAVNTPAELFDMAKQYLFVTSLGYVATVFYNLFAQILRALGDSRTPLYFLIFTSALNIGLDFALILGAHMGVAGAALATVVSQLLSAALTLVYAVKKFSLFRLKKEHWKCSGRFFWEHLRIGLPMCFQFSISAIGAIFVQSVVNTYDPLVIATVSGVMRLESFVMQALICVGTASATFTAQNYGALAYDRVRQGVRVSVVVEESIALVAMVIMLAAGPSLTTLFVADVTPQQIEIVKEYSWKFLVVHAPAYLAAAPLSVFRNVLQGAGRSSGAMYAGLADVGMRAAAAFGLAPLLGFWGICAAEPLAWVLADVVQIAIYVYMMRGVYKKKPPESSEPTANPPSA